MANGKSLSGARPRTTVIIPALNEAGALPLVLKALPSALVDEVIVADNGSTDSTPEVARSHGARVVHAPLTGYGSACLAGAAYAEDAAILVFLDGDYSDDPRELPLLLEPLVAGRADLVIGSRILGRREKGSLLPQARWGNALASLLIRVLFKRRVTDLGPFRALTREAFGIIDPDDRAFGFPVQTQVRAIIRGLRVVEVPVSYRRRIGRSKISGTLSGTMRAGRAIVFTILREFWRSRRKRSRRRSSSRGELTPPPATA